MPLVTEPYDLSAARVSADGNWVLYEQEKQQAGTPAGIEVMRVPIAGGTPQTVLTARRGSFIRCARVPSKLCVLIEPTEANKRLIVTLFDPLRGRGSELTRFDFDPILQTRDLTFWALDLSSDGTRMAAIRNPDGPVQILSLAGHVAQEIKVKGWSNLRTVNWAAGEKGLYIVSITGSGYAREGQLLYVDLAGNATVLSPHGSVQGLTASPDGRHLAWARPTTTSNIWMLENF